MAARFADRAAAGRAPGQALRGPSAAQGADEVLGAVAALRRTRGRATG